MDELEEGEIDERHREEQKQEEPIREEQIVLQEEPTVPTKLVTPSGLTNIDKRQSNLLRKLCPNSGDCVSLGKFVPLLKQYFENFKQKYAYEIKRIGTPSNNGFVNAITYRKDGYDAYCVLKSASRPTSDNLFYEWWIGEKFINKLVDKFPCFVETYDMHIHDNDANYEMLKTNRIINKQTIDSTNQLINIKSDAPSKININDFIELSCEKPTTLGVLIQHLNPTQLTSFYLFVEDYKSSEIGFNLLIFQVLLQLFIPLGSLANHFTHNDLHGSNILLYRLPNKQYVTLKYTFKDKTVTMKTPYIVKMIDYGRSYYSDYDNPTNSSPEFFSKAYKLPKCANKDRDDIGYGYFEPPTINNYFISQLQPNVTKDLWMIHYLGRLEGKYRSADNVCNGLRSLLIGHLIDSPDDYMSVKSTTDCEPDKPICNVIALMNTLCQLWLSNSEYINNLQDRYISSTNLTPMGELTIYPDDLSKDSHLLVHNDTMSIAQQKFIDIFNDRANCAIPTYNKIMSYGDSFIIRSIKQFMIDAINNPDIFTVEEKERIKPILDKLFSMTLIPKSINKEAILKSAIFMMIPNTISQKSYITTYLKELGDDVDNVDFTERFEKLFTVMKPVILKSCIENEQTTKLCTPQTGTFRIILKEVFNVKLPDITSSGIPAVTGGRSRRRRKQINKTNKKTHKRRKNKNKNKN